MARKKKIEQKNNCTLKTSKGLRACTVVLHDIALETDLIQRYQLHLPLKKDTSIHSINKQLLIKKNVQTNDVIENGRYTITKNCSKKTINKKKGKNYENVKSQQNKKDINKDILLSHQYDETTVTQQLTHGSNAKSSSNKNTDEISSTSTDTHFNYMQKMTVLMNNKNNKDVRKLRKDSKAILRLNKPDITNDTYIKLPKDSNNTTCLDKKNITVVDYNSNMEEISGKSITHTPNNNLLPIDFSDGINCGVKREQCKKNQNSKDSIVQTTCNGGKSTRNETKRSVTKRNLPRIIGNHVLPEGAKILKEIKVEKLRINNNLQSSTPKQISLEQDRCNNNDKNRHEISRNIDTIETTNIILNEKECHTSLEINGSINTSKISSPHNNNVDLKDKNLPIDKSYSKVIDCKNLNSITKVRNNYYINNTINNNDTESKVIMRHENYTLNDQGQLSKFTNDTGIHENNALQGGRKCKEKCIKNILNKNTSDLMDIDNKNCNFSTSLISANKEETVKQTLKRTLKEKDKDYNLDSKKMKLNRNSWLQNNDINKTSINNQCNDSSSTVTTDTTIETNIFKEYNQEQKSDLHNFLKQMKSKRDFKLKSTVKTENEEICKKLSAKEELTLSGTVYEKKNNAQEKHTEEHTNVVSDNEEDDCISLFAESFAEFTSQCEDQSLYEKNKSYKSLHSDIPYPMTASSFDKYVKQNNKEFNKEYADCIENNIEASKSKANEISNNQSIQVLNIDCTSATIESKSLQTRNIYPTKETIYNFIRTYCYTTLRFGTDIKHQCKYKHDVENVFHTVNVKDSKIIIDIIQEAVKQNFNYFCEQVYIASLKKLTVDQILKIYKMFHENWDSHSRRDFTIQARKNIACSIIKELLNREMSLKIIIDHMMTLILPTRNLNELYNILMCVDMYVKPGEYWKTVKNIILKRRPHVCKQIVEKILHECIQSNDLQNIQDVNNNLINKLDSTLISTLDKYAIKCFKNILVQKTAKNSYSKVLINNFGESLTTGTIASPDSPDPCQSVNFTQQELPISPTRDDISLRETDINQNENHVTQDVNLTKPYKYGFMQPIDASYARSVYRDHERFWKFYMDLERFEKGLIYEDYDYVIDILKSYTEKRESELFVSKCCLVLQNVKRSEYHFKNILRLTVQMDVFSILSKILFDIGLNILANLVDEEAWGLALQLIQSLNIYDLPYNAEYFLLSAEIYLANKKAVKAYDLLKYQNIICTSCDKWYVKSTTNDKHVRNKIIDILFDSLCDEFLEHAFFLFQFLLKDQSSYYTPIDLSYYADKLIILSLSKKDTTLITEMGNLVLKHSFVLSTITCRALISTIIHTDEVLARQIYNYAEGIGIYSTVKLLPITHIIINTDLTEEEIYLIFLQLIKNLIMNFGHAIEFAKPHQIKIKINKQFYCAALQNHYNNKAIINAKTLIKNVLKKRFDPPILLMKSNVKGRVGKLQSKSLINYLQSEHCN
ncbi:metacaspase-2-like isoform X3 [Cataglyphis hispanica]|uniref:metacaspase-2-like isoform X3 n=1 Tax=Cataglyphis hispanica TaxID=1086592 RepID=UPI00217F72F9|nr:metacaspase-2-like isoform X3 [Cataglyphis hispanica]